VQERAWETERRALELFGSLVVLIVVLILLLLLTFLSLLYLGLFLFDVKWNEDRSALGFLNIE
jgi:hypothetical protein